LPSAVPDRLTFPSDWTGNKRCYVFTALRRIPTFRSMTDRIYDGSKNFCKLLISWLWRKITCQTKSSIWINPPYSGKGCLEGLSSVRRPSQCQVSSFVSVHSMTFVRRRNRLTTHFSERIPVVKRRTAVVIWNTHSWSSKPVYF